MLQTGPCLSTALSLQIYNPADINFNQYWRDKLTASTLNPFPLAPKQYRKSIKELSFQEYSTIQNRYHLENQLYGNACSRFVLSELDSISNSIGANALRNKQFNVLGAGLARDLDWIKSVNVKYAMKGEIYDFCDLALGNAAQVLNKSQVLDKNVLNHRTVSQDGDVNPDAILTFGSGFIQVQSKPQMETIMRTLGRGLKTKHSKLMLIHATGNRNINSEWGDTKPYFREDLLKPLQQGLGKQVVVQHKGDIKYWNQIYECLVFQARK